MINIETITYALLGGVLPAVLWLFFWLEEDIKNPEPDSRLLKAFLMGMIAVIVVIPVQRLTLRLFSEMNFSLFAIWAAIEEICKFSAAYFIAIRTKDDNEPLDALVYMITVALGFAALENTLFILNPLFNAHIVEGVVTGHLRFIGASLLHILASGIVGTALALSFYDSRRTRIMRTICGVIVAVMIHAIFNLMIIHQGGFGTLLIFAAVWSGIALLLLMCERVKAMKVPLSTEIS